MFLSEETSFSEPQSTMCTVLNYFCLYYFNTGTWLKKTYEDTEEYKKEVSLPPYQPQS